MLAGFYCLWANGIGGDTLRAERRLELNSF